MYNVSTLKTMTVRKLSAKCHPNQVSLSWKTKAEDEEGFARNFFVNILDSFVY